jgi:FKBP-type peptidyl-prolyl cis-trans isomerase FkpA
MPNSMNPSRLRRALGLLVVPVAAAVAACSVKSDLPVAPSTVTNPESATYAPALGVDLANSTKTSDGLFYRDLKVGTGTVVAAGTRVSVRYAGFLTNGQSFDSSKTGQPLLPFTQGIGEVVPGFDQGVLGMRVGGSRQIIIPPSLGYGANARGSIPASSILVFRVDLVGAQ